MKIDLTKVQVQPSLLNEPKEVDVHKIVADLIWKDCARVDISKANFALKLFNTEGEIEITDEEKQYILDIGNQLKFWLAQGIENVLNCEKNCK